jgi:hypothetical protein
MAAALPASIRDELATPDIRVDHKGYTLNKDKALKKKLSNISDTRQCDVVWKNKGQCCNIMLDTESFEGLRARIYNRYQLGQHANGEICLPGQQQHVSDIRAGFSVSTDKSDPPLITEDKVSLFINCNGKWSKWVYIHAYRTNCKLMVQGTAPAVQHFMSSELPILVQDNVTPQDAAIDKAYTDTIRSVVDDSNQVTEEEPTDDVMVSPTAALPGDCDVESSPDSPSLLTDSTPCTSAAVQSRDQGTPLRRRKAVKTKPYGTAKRSSPAMTRARSSYGNALSFGILENKVESLILDVAGLNEDRERLSTDMSGQFEDFKVKTTKTNSLEHRELLDVNTSMRAAIKSLEDKLKSYDGKMMSLQQKYINLEKKLDAITKKQLAAHSEVIVVDKPIAVDKSTVTQSATASEQPTCSQSDLDPAQLSYSVDTSNRFTMPVEEIPETQYDAVSDTSSENGGFVIPTGCRTVILGTSMVKYIDAKRLGMASYVIALNGAHLTDIHDLVCTLPLKNCDGVRHVILMAGSNDCKQTPTRAVEDTMVRLLTAIKTVFGNACVKVSSCLPRRGKLEYYNSNIAQLNTIWRNLCDSNDADYIDNDETFFDTRGVPKRQLYDGLIHLSGSGSGRLAMTFIKHIRPPRSRQSRPDTNDRRGTAKHGYHGYGSSGQSQSRIPPRRRDRAVFDTNSNSCYMDTDARPRVTSYARPTPHGSVPTGDRVTRESVLDRRNSGGHVQNSETGVTSSDLRPPQPSLNQSCNLMPEIQTVSMPTSSASMPPALPQAGPPTIPPIRQTWGPQVFVNGAGYNYQQSQYMPREPWYSNPPVCTPPVYPPVPLHMGPPPMPTLAHPGYAAYPQGNYGYRLRQ